jgi:hypothetical protein
MNIYTQVRGLWPEAAKLWAPDGGEEAVVRRLREGARGGAGRQQQEVRGLRPEAAKLWAAGGGEDAVVRRLREGARGGAGRQQEEVREEDKCTRVHMYYVFT